MQELEKLLEEIESRIEYLEKIKGKYEDGNEKMAIWFRIDEINRIKKIIRKHKNDGWISVKERMPEDDVDVLVTYADIDDENYTDICITTYGYAYLGGNKLDFKEWRSPFEYFKTNYKVIAWKPLTEPYRPERSERE